MTYLEIQKGLGPDDYILFVNTGWEDNRSLDFLRDQQLYWGAPIRYLEYCAVNGWKEVTYDTCARVDWFSTDVAYLRQAIANSPFWRRIMAAYLSPGKPRDNKAKARAAKGYPLFQEPNRIREVLMLPNIAAKFCTQELKVRVMRDFMRSQGYTHWQMVQGIRADEPHRLHKSKDSKEPRWDNVYPLADAGITEKDVRAFWRRQPFDLQLESYEGNCRFCFEKNKAKLQLLTDETPIAAQVLAETEEATRTTFIDKLPLQAFLNRVGRRPIEDQRRALLEAPPQPISCFCGD
ncbi:adenine nucleotide alpha hydrolase family protein [Hymenobacter fodinae]|nr:hypothetical protein [Hymenobacter fodinae]